MYASLIVFILMLSSSVSYRIASQKFCVNCKYFIQHSNPNVDNRYGKCSLYPINDRIRLVTGNNKDITYAFCSTARTFENMCGAKGKSYKKSDALKNKVGQPLPPSL